VISNAMLGSPYRYTGRGPTRARTPIGHDIVACVMATLTTGEPSLGADGEEESRSSIAMAKTWRVTLGHLRDRLLGHGTGRGRRVVAFALAGRNAAFSLPRAGWRLRLV
jgi:hypothetical protein